MVSYNISNRDDVQQVFKDSWPIFALTDFWAQPDQPEVEIQQGFFKTQKSADGTVVFAAPIDTCPVVRKILDDPDKYVGQDICICGEAIQFGDISKVFTKVTDVPAIAETLTEEEFRSGTQYMPKPVQNEIIAMFQWFEEYDYYGKDKDWTSGQKLTVLNTFEQWLKKIGWKG
ncbi:unnamed protein product [Rotaria sordida]|uniref:NmrA-like family domain-containing protein 1 n=1 Tax=Rotaria sordida TaxID=392033 RepID=A0A820FJ70_9BILA|nr:unnamed protein product [Rotaria sordida]